METANIINLIVIVMRVEKERRRKERRSAIGSIMLSTRLSVPLCIAAKR